MIRSAAIIIANGYTDCEFLVAYHYLLAEDFEVNVSSLDCGPVTGVQGWVHKKSDKILDNEPYELFCDVGILVLIGGVKAIEKLRLYKPLIAAVARRNAKGQLIASICHGAQIMVEADIVRGKTVLGYYSIRKDLENAGAIWPEGFEIYQYENIISATHYDYSGKWIKTAVECYENMATA